MNEVYIPSDLKEVMMIPICFQPELTKFDVIEVFSKDRFVKSSTSYRRCIKAPGQFSYYDKNDLKDLFLIMVWFAWKRQTTRLRSQRIVNFNEAKDQNE